MLEEGQRMDDTRKYNGKKHTLGDICVSKNVVVAKMHDNLQVRTKHAKLDTNAKAVLTSSLFSTS